MAIEFVLGGLAAAGGLFLLAYSKLRRIGMADLRAMPANQAYLEEFIRISTIAARDALARNRTAMDDEIVEAIIAAFRSYGYAPKTILKLSVRGMLPDIRESVELLADLEPQRPDALEQVIRFRTFDFGPGHFRPDIVFSAYPIKTPEIRHQEIYEWLALDKDTQTRAWRRAKIRHASDLGLQSWAVGAVLNDAVANVQRKFPKASRAEIATAASHTAAEELRHLGCDTDVPRLTEILKRRMVL